MKKSIYTLALITIISSFNLLICQVSPNLLGHGAFEDQSNNPLFFVNDEHLLIYPGNQSSEKSLNQYVWLMKNFSPKTDRIELKVESAKDSRIIHIEVAESKFTLYESFFDAKNKTIQIIEHAIVNGELISKKLLAKYSNKNLSSPTVEFVSSDMKKSRIILITETSQALGGGLITSIELNYDGSSGITRETILREKNQDLKSKKVFLTEHGQLLLITEIDHGEGKKHLIYTIDVRNSKIDFLNTVIEKNNDKEIVSYRAYIDLPDNLIVYAIVKGIKDDSKPSLEKYIIGSDQSIKANELNFNYVPNPAYHIDGILPISEDFTIFGLRNSKDQDMNSKNSSSSNAIQENPAILFVCIDKKGNTLWEQKINSNFHSKIAIQKSMHSSVTGFSYWIHDNRLICLYNNYKEDKKLVALSQDGGVSTFSIEPTICVFELKSGSYRTSPLKVDEFVRHKNPVVLTGKIKFPNMKFGMCLVQTEDNKFIPLQLML